MTASGCSIYRICIMKFSEARGGEIASRTAPRRIENMRKKYYNRVSGEPARDGVCEFYILPREFAALVEPRRRDAHVETRMQIIVWALVEKDQPPLLYRCNGASVHSVGRGTFKRYFSFFPSGCFFLEKGLVNLVNPVG